MIVVFILAVWWLFWGVVATYSGSRLDPVSDSVLVLVILFASNLVLGGLLQNKEKGSIKFRQPNYVIVSRISLLVLFLLFVLQTPVWFYLIQNILEGGSITQNRHEIFSGDHLSALQKLIFGCTSALIYNYLVISSIVFFHIYSKPRFLIIAVSYLAIAALLKGSRSEIYQFIMVSSVYFIGVYGLSIFDYIRKYKCWVVVFTVSSLLLLTFVSYSRGHNPIQGAVDYHTVGFVLLTKFVNGLPAALENDYSYGISYFGGVDYLIGLIGKLLFWDDFQSFTRASLALEGDMLPTFTYESRFGEGLEVSYAMSGHNAFYTLLVSGYKSFGVYGVTAMGLVFGYLVHRWSLAARRGDVPSAFYLILLVACILMGIFSSALETLGFWLALMMINIILYVSFWVDVRK